MQNYNYYLLFLTLEYNELQQIACFKIDPNID